ncbi:MAG: Stringent starvation protein [Pseudomonadota bacterium]
MSELTSTKPYMVRAIHEWCVDNQLTPHLLVAVNSATRVPMAFVKDGEIVLNLNYSATSATKDLHFSNEAIIFSARFGGMPNELFIPMSAVKGIFARENGQGMFFEVGGSESMPEQVKLSEASEDEKNNLKKVKKPSLKLVK